jgi:hypothetical protein
MENLTGLWNVEEGISRISTMEIFLAAMWNQLVAAVQQGTWSTMDNHTNTGAGVRNLDGDSVCVEPVSQGARELCGAS